MKFNNTYDNHIRKFISETKKSKDAEKESAEKEKDDEEEPPDDSGNEVMDSKMIELLVGEVEIYLLDTKENFRFHIKYLDDPKLSGYVQYEQKEDAERVYSAINTAGELLNYINLHAEMDTSIGPAINLLKKEVIAIKRDLTDEDIADLALEFPV